MRDEGERGCDGRSAMFRVSQETRIAVDDIHLVLLGPRSTTLLRAVTRP